MTEVVMTPEDFEDERLINYTQMKREYIVETLIKPNAQTEKSGGLPNDEGSRIMLMQALDGLSSVALKRRSMRQKAKESEDNKSMFTALASEVLRGMVGHTGKSSRTSPVKLALEHKQTYVPGELSTDQTVVEKSDIDKARELLVGE